jgi:transcriptional regulator with XRE-family HTH domain
MIRCCARCGREYTPLRRGYCNRCDAHRRALLGYRCSYVDAEPARLHIKALQAAGLGLRRISELSGVNRKVLQWVMTGRSERAQPPSARISARNARKIVAVPVPEVTHRVAAAHQLVDAVGTIRRLQALVAFGYPRADLARRLGVAPSNATRLFRADSGRVTAGLARRVEDLFGQLQMAPGPSSRARNEGAAKGWVLPFEWDEEELDHFSFAPGEACHVAPQRPQTVGELVGELRELGYGDTDIARRLNIQLESLLRRHPGI